MDESEARAVLGDAIQPDGDISGTVRYMHWRVGDDFATIDGSFTLDQIEALAWWMRAHGARQGVTDPGDGVL